MKTTFYIIMLIVFGGVLVVPVIPKRYPPKTVMDEQLHIVVQENHIDRLIHEIEYKIAKDSLHLKRH